jgi:hypothetical protein
MRYVRALPRPCPVCLTEPPGLLASVRRPRGSDWWHICQYGQEGWLFTEALSMPACLPPAVWCRPDPPRWRPTARGDLAIRLAWVLAAAALFGVFMAVWVIWGMVQGPY